MPFCTTLSFQSRLTLSLKKVRKVMGLVSSAFLCLEQVNPQQNKLTSQIDIGKGEGFYVRDRL